MPGLDPGIFRPCTRDARIKSANDELFILAPDRLVTAAPADMLARKGIWGETDAVPEFFEWRKRQLGRGLG
jgi:hypothetical protein